MDVTNKDEADKAYDIGKREEQKGNWERAKKFYGISLRLYATDEIRLALARVERKHSKQSSCSFSSSSSSSSSSSTSSEMRNRKKKVEENVEKKRPVSEKQRKAVEHVLSKKCYYEQLGIAKSASQDDIKRAWRKTSVSVHPDRNDHPRSEEAFKRLGKAYSTLSDSERRVAYDQFGPEDESGGAAAHRHGGARFANGRAYRAAGPIEEELFRAFFGGGAFARHRHFDYRQQQQQQQQRRRHHRQWNRGQSAGAEPQAFSLLKFLPVLMLFIFLFSSLSGSISSSSSSSLPTVSAFSSNHWSLKPTLAHTAKRTTHSSLSTAYYCTPQFSAAAKNQALRKQLRATETIIDRESLLQLRHACRLHQDKVARAHRELNSFFGNLFMSSATRSQLEAQLARLQSSEGAQACHRFQQHSMHSR
jgi:curved DNA-binding protein CbpA